MTYIPLPTETTGEVKVASKGEARATQAANVAEGTLGTKILTLAREIVIAGFDWTRSLLRVEEQNPHPHPIVERLVITNLATDVLQHWYINVMRDQHWSLQIIMSDGSGAGNDDLEVTAYTSNDDSVAVGAITDWSDSSVDILGAATISNAAGAVNQMCFVDTSISCVWVDVRYQRVAGAINNGNVTFRKKRWY